ncbi:MAG: Asp/Glu/hydantoin racemase, partial [Bdellovibrionales bacterium]|nr:Asp/Glu/hydantoin racemase [Massilia sp.]
TFERLLRAADRTLRVEHRVEEGLLTEAQRLGADDPALIARVQGSVMSAASTGASVVVCTCSTIGGAAERTPTGGRFIATRIGRAMADAAARSGPRILIVAALVSTLDPTATLIRESAVALHVPVMLELLIADGAWQHFVSGNHDAYHEAIVRAVRACSSTATVVVLAQASMAPAASALQDLGIAVLSSPELGVQSIVFDILPALKAEDYPHL